MKTITSAPNQSLVFVASLADCVRPRNSWAQKIRERPLPKTREERALSVCGNRQPAAQPFKRRRQVQAIERSLCVRNYLLFEYRMRIR